MDRAIEWPSDDAMIPNVQSALDTIVGRITTLKDASGAGRIFELFVMTSLARGLRNAQFNVWLQRSDGTIIQPSDADRRFIQRGGAPTGVPAASAGPDNASVIGFEGWRRKKWEIWNGIQFAGRSTATHEIDISIVPSSVGNAIRATGGIPVGRPRVAIECKDVGTAGSLDEMRAFVARLYDVTLLHAHHHHLPYPDARALHPGSPDEPYHRAIVTFWQENSRTKNIIARRTGFTAGAARLGGYYRIEPHRNIGVGSIDVDELVRSVVNWANLNA
jgi:hypothetical protein